MTKAVRKAASEAITKRAKARECWRAPKYQAEVRELQQRGYTIIAAIHNAIAATIVLMVAIPLLST